MKTIQLSQKEVNRSSNGLAIIARPQAGGGVRVMAVRVNGLEGTAFESTTFNTVVENKSGVSAAAKDMARWLDKLGFTCPMATAARAR